MRRLVSVVLVGLIVAACSGGTKLIVVEEKMDALGVNGVVRNEGTAVAKNVRAVVEWIDASGKLVAGVADSTQPPDIAPGATATFGLLLPPDARRSQVKSYRLKFESR